MKNIKRLNGLRVALWTMFCALAVGCVALCLANVGNESIQFYGIAISLILMWAICFYNTFLIRKERQLLARSVLKLISSVLKQNGIKRFSLNCEISEHKNYTYFEVFVEESLPTEVYLVCQESALVYLEPYAKMKRKSIDVNIIPCQSLVIGNFEG